MVKFHPASRYIYWHVYVLILLENEVASYSNEMRGQTMSIMDQKIIEHTDLQ
jgi:hypothetical protein